VCGHTTSRLKLERANLDEINIRLTKAQAAIAEANAAVAEAEDKIKVMEASLATMMAERKELKAKVRLRLGWHDGKLAH